jgi:hypothetical protein
MMHNHPRRVACTWKCGVYFANTVEERNSATYPDEITQ